MLHRTPKRLFTRVYYYMPVHMHLLVQMTNPNLQQVVTLYGSLTYSLPLGKEASLSTWLGHAVKCSLKKLLMNSCVPYGEMMTLVSEVEAIVNNPPPTFVYNELTESLHRHSNSFSLWQKIQLSNTIFKGHPLALEI